MAFQIRSERNVEWEMSRVSFNSRRGRKEGSDPFTFSESGRAEFSKIESESPNNYSRAVIVSLRDRGAGR